MSASSLLFKNRRPGETVFLDGYRRGGGYAGLEKAVRGMSPAEVREQVKASGLRGRGGAGFPTGVKWSFFPVDAPGDKYLVCNGDEMEPGTFKDRALLLADPHHLIEGVLIACYALRIPTAYIFLRDAYRQCAANLERAVAEARAAGLLGTDILGSDFNCEVHVHRSAGRYICGEETALLNSLEGRRPNPRSKPPFPAVRGLFGKPTALNNVETLANLPHILTGGAQWYADLALTDSGAGTKLYGLAGHIEQPGCYERPIGTPLC
jgi:NADH-quinone oxidoreductase subunit F